MLSPPINAGLSLSSFFPVYRECGGIKFGFLFPFSISRTPCGYPCVPPPGSSLCLPIRATAKICSKPSLQIRVPCLPCVSRQRPDFHPPLQRSYPLYKARMPTAKRAARAAVAPMACWVEALLPAGSVKERKQMRQHILLLSRKRCTEGEGR